MSKQIVLAGGCFWGMEAYFKRISGVLGTEVGYANGVVEAPNYEQVCTNTTGHAEVVYITYNPKVVSLETLLSHFWRVIDPTTRNRQGPDVGSQYRTGIYYTDAEDVAVIRLSLDQEQVKYDVPIVTEVMALENYYPAEAYHQDYLTKNPGGYCHIPL